MIIPGPVCDACRERQWAWIESNPHRVFPRFSIMSHAAYRAERLGTATPGGNGGTT